MMMKLKPKLIYLFSGLIFVVAIFQIVHGVFPVIKNRNLVDFMVYWNNWSKWSEGINIYLPVKGNIPFNYPPSTLIIFSFFKIFPLKIAEYLNMILSIVAFCYSIYLILKLLKFKIRYPWYLILTAFALQTFPFKFTLILGQVNAYVLMLSVMSLYLYVRSVKNNKTYYFLSAILMSLSVSMKILPVVTLPLFLLFGDVTFVLFVFSGLTIIGLASGMNLSFYYFQKVLPSLTGFGTTSFYDQSITAFLLRFGMPTNIVPKISLLITITIFVLIFTFFYRNLRMTKDKYRHYVLIKYFFICLSFISIAVNFSWQHHLVLAYPLIIMILLSFKKTISILTSIVVWFILFFHFPSEKSPFLTNPFIASYQTLTIFILTQVGLFARSIGYNMTDENREKNRDRLRLV